MKISKNSSTCISKLFSNILKAKNTVLEQQKILVLRKHLFQSKSSDFVQQCLDDVISVLSIHFEKAISTSKILN